MTVRWTVCSGAYLPALLSYLFITYVNKSRVKSCGTHGRAQVHYCTYALSRGVISAIARGFARRPVRPVPHDTVGRPA